MEISNSAIKSDFPDSNPIEASDDSENEADPIPPNEVEKKEMNEIVQGDLEIYQRSQDEEGKDLVIVSTLCENPFQKFENNDIRLRYCRFGVSTKNVWSFSWVAHLSHSYLSSFWAYQPPQLGHQGVPLEMLIFNTNPNWQYRRTIRSW